MFRKFIACPEYATFGHFNKAATDAAVADLVDVSPTPARSIARNDRARLTYLSVTQAEIADPTTDSKLHPSKSTVPRNSRKTGDGTGVRIEPQEYEETDALSLAPPRDGGSGVDVEIDRIERMKVHVEPEVDGGARIEDEKEDAKSASAQDLRSELMHAGLLRR